MGQDIFGGGSGLPGPPPLLSGAVRRQEGYGACYRSFCFPSFASGSPDRGLIEGAPPHPCAVFPGLHPGIRGVSIYDDGDELTLCVDDLTHGQFSEDA